MYGIKALETGGNTHTRTLAKQQKKEEEDQTNRRVSLLREQRSKTNTAQDLVLGSSRLLVLGL
jgi:hypothetical protein